MKEKIKFCFPVKDTRSKYQGTPWLVACAERTPTGRWTVGCCMSWLGPPLMFPSLQRAHESVPCCLMDENCIMTTNRPPSEKELVAFAKKIYKSGVIQQ